MKKNQLVEVVCVCTHHMKAHKKGSVTMGILPKVVIHLFLHHQLTIGGGKFGHLLRKKQGDIHPFDGSQHVDALVSCII